MLGIQDGILSYEVGWKISLEISSMRPLVDGHFIFHLHYESHGLAYGCVCSSVGGYECSHSMEDTCIYVLTHGMKLLRDILHYDEFT